MEAVLYGVNHRGVLDPSIRGLVVALVMAVLSPIMAALGGDGDKPEILRGEARGA